MAFVSRMSLKHFWRNQVKGCGKFLLVQLIKFDHFKRRSRRLLHLVLFLLYVICFEKRSWKFTYQNKLSWGFMFWKQSHRFPMALENANRNLYIQFDCPSSYLLGLGSYHFYLNLDVINCFNYYPFSLYKLLIKIIISSGYPFITGIFV